jgi:hypothetical protein
MEPRRQKGHLIDDLEQVRLNLEALNRNEEKLKSDPNLEFDPILQKKLKTTQEQKKGWLKLREELESTKQNKEQPKKNNKKTVSFSKNLESVKEISPNRKKILNITTGNIISKSTQEIIEDLEKSLPLVLEPNDVKISKILDVLIENYNKEFRIKYTIDNLIQKIRDNPSLLNDILLEDFSLFMDIISKIDLDKNIKLPYKVIALQLFTFYKLEDFLEFILKLNKMRKYHHLDNVLKHLDVLFIIDELIENHKRLKLDDKNIKRINDYIYSLDFLIVYILGNIKSDFEVKHSRVLESKTLSKQTKEKYKNILDKSIAQKIESSQINIDSVINKLTNLLEYYQNQLLRLHEKNEQIKLDREKAKIIEEKIKAKERKERITKIKLDRENEQRKLELQFISEQEKEKINSFIKEYYGGELFTLNENELSFIRYLPQKIQNAYLDYFYENASTWKKLLLGVSVGFLKYKASPGQLLAPTIYSDYERQGLSNIKFTDSDLEKLKEIINIFNQEAIQIPDSFLNFTLKYIFDIFVYIIKTDYNNSFKTRRMYKDYLFTFKDEISKNYPDKYKIISKYINFPDKYI